MTKALAWLWLGIVAAVAVLFIGWCFMKVPGLVFETVAMLVAAAICTGGFMLTLKAIDKIWWEE